MPRIVQLLLVFTLALLFAVQSQTDVSSFGIYVSSDSNSGVFVHLSLILSWNSEQWECIINTTVKPTKYYGCNTDSVPEATLITNALSSSPHTMKLNLIDIGTKDSGIDNLLRIETVTVRDDDNSFYDITHFCVPNAFSKIKTRGTSLESSECCYWSDRLKYNNFALGNIQNDALRMVYAMFRENVLKYPNQRHEGAIKPPMITTIGISTLPTPTASSAGVFALSLLWDSEVYHWNSLRPLYSNTTFARAPQSSLSSFCEFSSAFSLEIGSTSLDNVGIDRIIVIDEAGYDYTIEYFCNSSKMCDDKSSDEMYDGFTYSGVSSMYFIWTDDVFLNANSDQHAFALSDRIHYNCSKNVLPSSKITIFKDDMNDPISTGWAFSGSYTKSLNAVNCPGGPQDACSRIAGTGTMVRQLNIAQYANIVIQYDMTLSSMPAGKNCTLYYSFDNGSSWDIAKTTRSIGEDPILYANQTFRLQEKNNSRHTILDIKFENDAVSSHDYCWLDHIYIFGHYLIAFDNFESAPYSHWMLSGPDIITKGSYCLSGSCVYINSSGQSVVREYNNIDPYNNLVISFDLKTYSYSTTTRCSMSYSYDDAPYISVGPIPYPSGAAVGTFYGLRYDIPDATVCGATVLKIKFWGNELYTTAPPVPTTTSNTSVIQYCAIDNVKLWGNVLHTTSYPTASPVPTIRSTYVWNTASIQFNQSTSATTTDQTTRSTSVSWIYWVIGMLIVLCVVYAIVHCAARTGGMTWRDVCADGCCALCRKNKKGALKVPLLLEPGHHDDVEGGEGAARKRHTEEGQSIHLMDTLGGVMAMEDDHDMVNHINKTSFDLNDNKVVRE